MHVVGNFVASILVMVDSAYFVACQENIGVEQVLEVPVIAKGLNQSKVMGYTMVEEACENYMH